MKRILLSLVAAALALQASGCSGHAGHRARHPSPTTTGPTTSTTTTAAGRSRCSTAHLALSPGVFSGAAGTSYGSYYLTNAGPTTCTVEGYPGLAILDAQGNVVQHPASRQRGGTVMQISLLPGQSATFSSTSTDTVPNPDCPTAFTGTTLQVYPPGQTTPIRQPYSGSFCDLTVGPLQAIPRCHTSDLSPALTWIGAAAGNLGFVLYLANRSPTTCQVYGYVGMQLLDASRQPMETQVVRGSSMIFHDPGPTYIILEPGRVASAGIGFTDVPTGTNPSPCPTSTYVEITPPDETTYIIIQGSLGPCDGGTLDVTALQAGDHPRGPG